MVIKTLIKKDLKLLIKSPFTGLFKFLLVPVLACFWLLTINYTFKVLDPTNPKLLESSSGIFVGIIGKEKFVQKAKEFGATVSKYFPDKEAFDKYLGTNPFSILNHNYIEILEKNNKRQYNLIFNQDCKPDIKELKNWFSINKNGNNFTTKQFETNNLALLAKKIEEQILSEEKIKSPKIVVSFLEGGDSSLFSGKFITSLPFFLDICHFLVFFIFVQETVKETKTKTFNLLFRHGVTRIQLFASKFGFCLLFFGPGIGFTWVYSTFAFFSSLPAGVLLVLGANIFVLTILTGYLTFILLNSVKSLGFSSVFMIFGSIMVKYALKWDIWLGFKYLLQFLPFINSGTLHSLMFEMSVDL